jgi:hypothetical protein
MTARKPEFDWLLNGLEQVEEEIRKPIRKLYADPYFMQNLVVNSSLLQHMLSTASILVQNTDYYTNNDH